MPLTTITELAGWVLLHFVWQGAAVAGLVAVGLVLLRGGPAGARYTLACGGLITMVAAPITTAFVIAEPISGVAGHVRSVPTLAAERPTLENLLPALTALWLVGTSFFHVRLLLRWGRAERLRRAESAPLPRPLRPIVDDLVHRLGIRGSVRFVRSSLVRVPTVVGWLRPVVLIPASTITGLSPDQLRAVIAHELAHVRRHDYLVNILQSVCEALLFFHPAVWWVSNRIRIEREYCCDDLAVAVCGDAVLYARALSALDEWRAADWRPALAATGEPLMKRICRLVGTRDVRSCNPAGLAATLVVVLSAGVFTAAAALHAGDEADTPPAHGHAGIADIDVVGIAEALDLEDAELIATLRDLGLDNATLMHVVQALGADKRMVHTVHRLIDERDRLAAEMTKRHDELALQFAEGKITHDELERRLEKLHHRAIKRFQDVRNEVLDGTRRGVKMTGNRLHRRAAEIDAAAERLQRMQAHVKQEIDAGRLSSEQAQEHFEEIAAKTRELQIARDELALEMDRMHTRVDEMRADGLSDEEIHEMLVVEERSARVAERLQQEGDRVDERLAVAHARAIAARARIEKAVQSGALSEEEAKLAIEKMETHLEQARLAHDGELARAAAMARHVDALRAAGHTDAEIDKMLAAEHEKRRSVETRLQDRKLQMQDRLEALHVRAEAQHDRIMKAVQNGDMTEQEAKRRVAVLKDEIHATMRDIEKEAVLDDTSRRLPRAHGSKRVERLRLRLAEARHRLDDEVAAGAVSPEETARRREALDHLEQKLERKDAGR